MRTSNAAHYRARAFRLLAWPGWNYRRAMADRLRRHVIESVAGVIATDEWAAQKLRAFNAPQQ